MHLPESSEKTTGLELEGQPMREGDKYYFTDGFSPRRGLLGILAFPLAFKGQDAEYTMFYTTFDGRWPHRKLDFECRSVTYLDGNPKGSWFLLGKEGEIAEVGGAGRQERISDAGIGRGKFGYLSGLASVDGTLFACGDSRQVYQRGPDGKWQHIDGGVLFREAQLDAGFKALDGTASDNLYAVGSGGEIWHYNGNRWKQCESPTHMNLHEVRCLRKDLVYACGQAGIVLRGCLDQWEVLEVQGEAWEFWGVDALQDIVFVAGDGGIAVVRGNRIEAIDPGIGRKISGHRLRAGDGLLWSIGHDDILMFDGARWTEIVRPDNL